MFFLPQSKVFVLSRDTLLIKIFLTILILCSVFPASGQTITAIICSGDSIITSGKDGYITICDANNRKIPERFQLTVYEIRSAVKHPLKDEICIIESDGMENYRISVWNYMTKQRKFTLRSNYPVSYINYSAEGRYIIASGFDNKRLMLMNSENGRTLPVLVPTDERVSFAITGKAERNMLIYQSEGITGYLSYIDLDKQAVAGSFPVPGRLENLITFGNNRYLVGTNNEGLFLIDTANGNIFDRINEKGALLYSGGNDFYCVSTNENNPVIYQYGVDNNGRLTIKKQINPGRGVNAFAAGNNFFAFSSSDALFVIDGNYRVQQITYNAPVRIIDIALSGSTLALLTEKGELGFIALDYKSFTRSTVVQMTEKKEYTKINAISGDTGEFLLWQTSNTRDNIMIASSAITLSKEKYPFTSFPLRFPLHSISIRNNRILFLDSRSNITVYDLNNANAKPLLTFSTVGITDAAFADNDSILVSRSVVSGNSPFMRVNLKTGETVPIPYRCEAGILTFSGVRIWGAVIEQKPEGYITSIIDLQTSLPVFNYPGEDTHLSMAESGGIPAIVSMDGAVICSAPAVTFERTSGLPVKILGSSEYFISLDSEGNISWHNNKTGRILSSISFYENIWIMTKSNNLSGSIIRP
jgi:hypothetical protein